MKFAHRLNVRALSAMVTGIMVASSMLASAAPVAAVVEVANSVTVRSGVGLTGTVLVTDIGTFPDTPDSVSYKWYRCTSFIGASTSTLTGNPGGSCTDTGVTGTSYKILGTDILSPYIVAAVTSFRAGPLYDYHYSESYIVKSRPVFDALSTIDITGSNDGSGYARAGVTLLTINDGTWSGEPTPTIRYYWMRCSSASASTTNRASGCKSISDLDGGVWLDTYTPTNKDIGSFIRVRIVAHNQFGTTTVFSPSWAGGNNSLATNSANKISGAPFTTKKISIAGRRANPGTWTAVPALDSAVGYGVSVYASATDKTPGFFYQWYMCNDEVVEQSYTEDEWDLNRADGGCVIIPGETGRSLSVTEREHWYVVKITAQNTRGWTGFVYSTSKYIR